MEYEQALFRVYERCIEALREEDTRQSQNHCSTLKVYKACEVAVAAAGFFLLFVLVLLHQQFVGVPGCVPDALHNMLKSASDFKLHEDQILQVHIGNSPLYAVRTGQNETVPHFEFAIDPTILQLSDKFRADHNIVSYNVTLEASECFGSPAMQVLLPFGGTNIAVLNFMMYTFEDGAMKDNTRGDFWVWEKEQLYPYHNIGEWIRYKIAVVTHLFFFFMFLSGVTALIVRMLISSGVGKLSYHMAYLNHAMHLWTTRLTFLLGGSCGLLETFHFSVIIFPLLACVEQLGWSQSNFRLLALSYPWLGLPLEMLRNNNKPVMPYLLGHVFRVILYYGMYEACQLAWARWFYGEYTPSPTQSWMYALFMIWEYFTMIYVRSYTSIRIFPRLSASIVIIYQLYFMSFPGGFHSLALWVTFLLLLLSMLWMTRKLEVPAFIRGDVSIDQPRALFNELPWPAWQAALPPDWTLMLPVTGRSLPVYNNLVPARPGGGGGSGDGDDAQHGHRGDSDIDDSFGSVASLRGTMGMATARAEEETHLLSALPAQQSRAPEEVKAEHATTYDSVDVELGHIGIRRGHRYTHLPSSESR